MNEGTKDVNNQKTELIGQLYALRAGISVVSQEKEITDGILSTAKGDCRRAEQRKADRIATAKTKLEQTKSELFKKQQEFDNTYNLANDEMRCRKSLCAKRWQAGLLGFFGIPLIFYIVGIWMLSDPFVSKLEDVADAKKKLKESLEAKANLPKIQNEITELQTECNNLAKALEDTTENAEAQAVNETKEILDKAKQDAEPHVASAKEYLKTLEETFENLLDPRDWGNLDLFIYAIETRRADDIKSAFNYVDDERRTDRLASAIKYAGEQVCLSINGGLNKLSGDINRGFSLVSNNVTALGSGINKQTRQLAELADAQRMNNALTEKAAESSAALADDVKKLRTNSDYIDWRLHNNY